MVDSGATARETWIEIDGARLAVHDVGQGRPIVVLHGGPDFDYEYLLPDVDGLADLLDRLRALRIPTLVMTGDHDFAPAAGTRHIAEAIQGSRLVII